MSASIQVEVAFNAKLLTSFVDWKEAPFKQRVPEETIEERRLEIERKTFVISLKENHQGRFCRITEEVKGRRNAIIVPSDGLADLARIFTELAAAAQTRGLPPSKP